MEVAAFRPSASAVAFRTIPACLAFRMYPTKELTLRCPDHLIEVLSRRQEDMEFPFLCFDVEREDLVIRVIQAIAIVQSEVPLVKPTHELWRLRVDETHGHET